MAVAEAHLTRLGWRVEDTSRTRPYDFEYVRGKERIIVEVKGTTSGGEQVLLTPTEVDVQRDHYPRNALFVVHSIGLGRSPGPPAATGGALVMHAPWEIEDARLQPVGFQYFVPRLP